MYHGAPMTECMVVFLLLLIGDLVTLDCKKYNML